MKKYLVISLILIGFLNACVKQVDELSDNRTIIFKSSVAEKSITKVNAGIIEGTTFSYDDFGVYGYVTPVIDITNGGYLAKNAKYVKSGSIWVPYNGANYYWPKADNLSDIKVGFVAYAPYIANDGFSNDVITIPIDASSINDSCVDVMYAHVENVTPTSNPVSLHFNHALSWIEFVGKYAKDVKEVTITSIKFSSEIYNSGNLLLNVKNFSQSIDTDTSETTDPNLGDNVTLTAHDDGTGTVDYDNISSMLVLPQDVPAQVTITFNITIENATGEEIYYNGRTITRTINTGNDANKEYNASAGRTYVSEWEGGKRYIYRIFVTANDINFSVDVNDWTDENPFQIWDHNTTAYLEHFFGKASNVMAKNLVIA